MVSTPQPSSEDASLSALIEKPSGMNKANAWLEQTSNTAAIVQRINSISDSSFYPI